MTGRVQTMRRIIHMKKIQQKERKRRKRKAKEKNTKKKEELSEKWHSERREGYVTKRKVKEKRKNTQRIKA